MRTDMVSRREFLTGTSAAALGGAHAAPQPPRNVLLLCVDDLRPALRCYGDTAMHTPNIDRLAATGRLFDRHYVQCAVCGPSRGALLTGKPQASVAGALVRRLPPVSIIRTEPGAQGRT